VSAAAPSRLFHILAVDDSLADLLLLEEAIKHHGLEVELSKAGDGDEALALLRSGELRPDLVLLDLNMPRQHGRDVLSEVKGDPALRSIPVIIFSTSSSPHDVAECYALHANSYLVKPVDFDGLGEVVKALDAFWVRTASLPGGPT
jgi:CheY-like chemotaxis protein